MRSPWSLVSQTVVLGALLSVGLGSLAIAEPTDFPAATAPSTRSPAPAPVVTTADEDEDEDDGVSRVDVLTCSGNGGEAEVQLDGVGGGADGERYEWTLSRDGRVTMRGSFTYVDNDEDWNPGTDLFEELIPGVYRLTFYRAGETDAVDQQDFEVLRCVTATSGCRSMTFTNPPENPALAIRYGAGEDDGSDDPAVDDERTITVAPGQTRTVSTLREVAGWEASRRFSENQPRSFGGEDWQVDVGSHCGDTMTRGRVACAPSPQSNAQIDMWFVPPRDRLARYKVFDFHELVDSGPVGADQHLQLHLPPSYYDLHFFTDANRLPYDRVFVEVPTCLRVASTCRGLSLRDLTTWTEYAVTYQVDDGPTKTLRVQEGGSKQLPLPSGSVVTWQAATNDHVDGVPIGWQASAGQGRAVAGVCGVDHGDLASTGSPRDGLGVLLVAGALVLTGAASVTRGGWRRA